MEGTNRKFVSRSWLVGVVVLQRVVVGVVDVSVVAVVCVGWRGAWSRVDRNGGVVRLCIG